MITIHKKKPMWAIQGKNGETVEVDRATYMKVLKRMMMKRKKSA